MSIITCLASSQSISSSLLSAAAATLSKSQVRKPFSIVDVFILRQAARTHRQTSAYVGIRSLHDHLCLSGGLIDVSADCMYETIPVTIVIVMILETSHWRYLNASLNKRILY